MSKCLKFIPNILTFFSATCGLSAILVLLKTDTYMSIPIATILILVAVCADFFDGYTAKKFDACSKIGEYFDSLADMISFGVAPAILINSMSSNASIWAIVLIGAASIIYALCGLFRLARYNASSKSDHFTGLPITAAGFIVAIYCLVWYLCQDGKTGDIAFIAITVPLSLIIGFLMVSHLKVMRLAKSNNKTATE